MCERNAKGKYQGGIGAAVLTSVDLLKVVLLDGFPQADNFKRIVVRLEMIVVLETIIGLQIIL